MLRRLARRLALSPDALIADLEARSIAASLTSAASTGAPPTPRPAWPRRISRAPPAALLWSRFTALVIAAVPRVRVPWCPAGADAPHANLKVLRRYVVLLCLLRDVASAFSYLASPPPGLALPPIVHRDVKPTNILLSAQVGGRLLCGFCEGHARARSRCSIVAMCSPSADWASLRASCFPSGLTPQTSMQGMALLADFGVAKLCPVVVPPPPLPPLAPPPGARAPALTTFSSAPALLAAAARNNGAGGNPLLQPELATMCAASPALRSPPSQPPRTAAHPRNSPAAFPTVPCGSRSLRRSLPFASLSFASGTRTGTRTRPGATPARRRRSRRSRRSSRAARRRRHCSRSSWWASSARAWRRPRRPDACRCCRTPSRRPCRPAASAR